MYKPIINVLWSSNENCEITCKITVLMCGRMHELAFCDSLSYRSINIFSKFKVCEMLAMYILISILTSIIVEVNFRLVQGKMEW